MAGNNPRRWFRTLPESARPPACLSESQALSDEARQLRKKAEILDAKAAHCEMEGIAQCLEDWSLRQVSDALRHVYGRGALVISPLKGDARAVRFRGRTVGSIYTGGGRFSALNISGARDGEESTLKASVAELLAHEAARLWCEAESLEKTLREAT